MLGGFTGTPGGDSSGAVQSSVTPASALSKVARETPAALASGQMSAVSHAWNAPSTRVR